MSHSRRDKKNRSIHRAHPSRAGILVSALDEDLAAFDCRCDQQSGGGYGELT